jgi:hypothetical protein
MTVGKLAEQSGLFLLNSAIAVVGTSILASEFRFNRQAIETYYMKRDIVNGMVAFGLGYFCYRRWQWNSSKWVWLVGLVWFGQRTIRFWIEQHGPLSAFHGSVSVFAEMSGIRAGVDVYAFRDWSTYTIPFLHMTFYSCGAFFCSWFRQHESAAVLALKTALPFGRPKAR